MITHNQGWICLWRKMQTKGWYTKSAYVHLWVHLLFLANHEQNEFMWNGKMVKIRPGQFITGRKHLSEKTRISQTSIERILNCFQNEQQIEQQKTTKFRLITIKNWITYQEKGQQNGQQADNKRTTSGQQTDTNNNVNNDNNVNNTVSKPDGSQKEVNKIMDIFYKINPSLNYGNRTQREAVSWGLKKWGMNEMLRMVEYAVAIQGRDYAPEITTPLEFKNKIAKVKIFKEKQDKKDKPNLIIAG